VAWMFVCCECCVLSGRSLCDELLTRPVESYRLDRNLKNEEATAHFGPQRHGVGGNIGYTYGLSVLPAYQLRINKLKYTLTRICACCFTWAWNVSFVLRKQHVTTAFESMATHTTRHYDPGNIHIT